jgi:hypothetical protein
MNKFFSKNRILIAATLVLSLVAVILIVRQNDSTIREQDQQFAVQDTGSITRIFMAKKDSSQVLLSKNEQGQWMVNNEMRASQKAVQVLLETLKKMDIKRPVSKAEHNSVIKRLSSIGVKVEIYQRKPLFRLFGQGFFVKERKANTFYVGDATQNNLGTYMYREGAKIPYVVGIPGFRGYLTPRFKAKADKWRNHTMMAYNLNEIQSVEVRHMEDPKSSFRLSHPNNRQFSIIKLHNDQPVLPFDTLKVLDFLSSFHSVKFEDLVNDYDKKDSIINSTPFHIIRVTDREGNTREIKTYHRKARKGLTDVYGEELKYDPDRLYATFNEKNDFALIQFYIFDNLTKKANYFLPQKPKKPNAK